MTENNEREISGASLDVAGANRARLRALFPSVFTETRDEKGNLVESVDFEKLKAELGTFTDLFEARRERYGLDWPGKKDCLKVIQGISYATLKPVKEESVSWEATENLFVEGDNLEVLKLLQKSYYGKVKMIYVDPPYNTGKEFIYPDNFSESLETYLAYAGLADDEGRKFSTNTASEGRFHTKWLNMMYPRLYIARNLLRDDGLFFASIDENEVCNLRKACDEVFGEENFVQQLVWKRHAGGGNDSKHFAIDHEYLLVYAKNKDSIGRLRMPLSEEDKAEYKSKDQYFETLGPYKTKSFSRMRPDDPRPTLTYDIAVPDGTKVRDTWKWEESRFLKALEEEKVLIRKDRNGKWQVEYKIYLNAADEEEEGESEEKTKVPRSLLLDVERNSEGKKQLREALGRDNVFNNPKPTGLIKHLMSFGMGPEDVVVDFFAGSGTTGQAVVELNKADGGRRKFVCVQLPEPCDEGSEAFKAGYKKISDATTARLKKVCTDNGSGFRKFRLDRSCFRRWQSLPTDSEERKIAEQLDLHVEHVDPSAGREDILFEILLKAGFRPTEEVAESEMAGATVYSMADGALLVCLADRVTKGLIDAVAEAEPVQFVCLDSAFGGNDQLKANAVQTFAALNQGRDKATQIIFRTV